MQMCVAIARRAALCIDIGRSPSTLFPDVAEDRNTAKRCLQADSVAGEAPYNASSPDELALANGLGLRVQDFRLALEFSMDAPKGPQYYSAWICVAAIYPSKYLSIHTHILYI